MTGHYPEPSPIASRPVAYHGCVCTCHVFPGVKHLAACCTPYAPETPAPESQPGWDAMRWKPDADTAPTTQNRLDHWEVTITARAVLTDGSPSRVVTSSGTGMSPMSVALGVLAEMEIPPDD